MKKLLILGLVSLASIFFSSDTGFCAAVKVYTDVDKPIVLAGSDETVVLKVGLRPDEPISSQKRFALNVAVVLDKSGSMASGEKIDNAKRGAIEIVEHLSNDDIFSLIVYDTTPRVVIPAQHIDNKDALIALIRGIFANGSTALYGGVDLAASEVRKNISPDYLNRVILLSDGLANVGPQTTEEIAELGNFLSKEGISISTIGVGLDYNEDLMTALAQAGDGNSYFAKNSDELPRIFAEEVGEAMTLMAKNINVNVECSEVVTPVAIIGRKGAIRKRVMQASINNLYGKNEKYTLFEVKLPKGEDAKTIQLASVTVEYVDPFTKKTVSQTQTLSVRFDKHKEIVEAKQNKAIIKEVAFTKMSETKQQVVALADKGDFKQASYLLKDSISKLEETAKKCDNDKELLTGVDQFDRLSREIRVNKGVTRYQRKRLVNEAATQISQQGYVSQGQ